ncbi:MAG: nitrilase, partial [Thermodesulfobacteriota bacterium]|nr:nitrilase [Thermodesulfobacteriota bacterium]
MEDKKKSRIKVRRWRPEDIEEIVRLQRAAYPNFSDKDLCDDRVYSMQLAAFPEGQLLAELDGKVVGYATSLIVVLDENSPWYSYSEITGVGTFKTHNP